MKAINIEVGKIYIAKVSNKLVKVRVDAIRREDYRFFSKPKTFYDVTNLSTGRKTTFRSAGKFRSIASAGE